MAGETFRWGVMGPGNIANRFAEAVAAVPGAELHAVGSRDIGRARAFAGAWGARRAYGSYEELARDEALDAVYIATPHTQHCENALLCLSHGKAVLCEKPLTVNAGFARRMAEQARRSRTFLMEAMWSRFLPAARRARELVACGAIGEPRMITADFSYASRPDPSSRIYDPGLAGGGLLDVGVYPLSFASMFFGPAPLESSSFSYIGPTGVDEHAAMLLKYPGGQVAALTCGIRASGTSEACVMGTEGRMILSPFWKAEALRVERDGSAEDHAFPFLANGFEYQIIEVMDCVRRGLAESPLLPLGESIAVLETMDGFRRQWGLKYPVEQEC